MDFLQAYRFYSSANYAPPVYHDWCALFTLSTMLSRRVWLSFGQFRFFPNIYNCLIGEPGWGKNTAIEIAQDIVEEIGPLPIAAERQSKEDLICRMAPAMVELAGQNPDFQTPYAIIVTELEQFFAIDPEGMVGFLTMMYDKKNDARIGTLRHGEQVIAKPYLSMLAGCQPDTLGKYIRANVISNGFARRCNFIFPTSLPKRKALYEITPQHGEAQLFCLDWCRRVQTLSGPFLFEEDALKRYIHWFETRSIGMDPAVRQYDENMHVMVLRLSMLLSVAHSLDMRITTPLLEESMSWCDTVKRGLPSVLGSIGRNDLAPLSEKVLTLIRNSGGVCPEKTIRSICWRDGSTADLQAVLSHLIAVDLIEVKTLKHEGVERSCLILKTT